MISVHDMKLESTVTYQEGCEVKRNTIYKRCPLIDLIENALLENHFMIPNFKRRISGYIKCQMYYEIATLYLKAITGYI